MNKKVLVVGGVAGGATAASRLRRLDEEIDITIFEKGEHISFANCGLPYYAGGVIEERDKLLLRTPEEMKEKYNIDVKIKSKVIGVNGVDRRVKVKSNEGIYEESFDYLILAPGAKHIIPDVPGADSNKIFTVKNVTDIDKIKGYMEKNSPKSAIIIGGGFIGIEMADNLRERDMDVTIIQSPEHILNQFDSEFSKEIEKELNDNEVSLILNQKAVAFSEDDNSITAILEGDRKIKADMIICSVGIKPDTDFLKDSGIILGEEGHILVNDHMETNIKGVYAAGDAVATKDLVTGDIDEFPLAGPANRQGRIIANNIAGLDQRYKGSLGSFIVKVFDLTAASTGNSEKKLIKKGIEYDKVHFYPKSHAGYYPNTTKINAKVIYGKDGKILGAQALGYENVDKFIDVISTAMNFGGTMEDLTDLDLGYAPPYSSPKSPANIAGFIAENQRREVVKVTNSEEIKESKSNDKILLDVREKEEVLTGKIKNSINIPLDTLRTNLDLLDKNKEIVVYCVEGLRGYKAARILTANGYNVKNLNGGYRAYTNKDYEAKEIEFKKKNEDKLMDEVALDNIKELNVTGLSCPGPLMQVKVTMDEMFDGEVVKVRASDPGFYKDIEAWANKTNNRLINIEKNKGIVEATIMKCSNQLLSSDEMNKKMEKDFGKSGELVPSKNGQTMVVFSGDLDKAIASFIIANGAAALGKKVTMFFTFWGLNVLRKPEKVKVPKNIIEKAFGMMMPRGSKRLGLSKMNMGGMGAKMIRGVMKDKNIQSLEDLMDAAIKSGVEIVACTMSMDVMGIKKEELIDGINYAGVGYYLGEADDSNINLFI